MARYPFVKLLGAIALGTWLAGPAQAQAPQGPPTVGTVALDKQPVPFTLTVPGRAVAFEEGDIRPQVSGLVQEIVYSPSEPVKKGDVMFRIDSAVFEAEARAAEAAVSQAESAVQNAQNTLDRYQQLRDLTRSPAQIEDAEVAVQSAEAALGAARAQAELAHVELGRTEVRSPIDGEASVALVSVGAVVTANQTDPLATVTRLDPIYLDVAEAGARVLQIQQQIAEGTLAPDAEIGFALRLENGDLYDQPGRLVAQSAGVSASTGTREFRIEFPNPDRRIRPGQFLRVDVTLGERSAYLVPQRAARRSAGGALTFYVVRDGKAVQVETRDLGTHDNGWVVAEGPKDGDRLIVDGLTGLRTGTEVKAEPVHLNDDGVVVAGEN